MTSYEQILYDVAGGVATVTLNRPEKLNAWTGQMEKEVRAAMAQAEADDAVRVIILTGAGRGFCAGADMQDLGKVAGASSPAEVERILKDRLIGPQRADALPDFQKTYSYFPAVGKPVIGAINGSTAGLGFVIALYCDIRIASDQAKFSTAFSRRGLIAEHGISWTLAAPRRRVQRARLAPFRPPDRRGRGTANGPGQPRAAAGGVDGGRLGLCEGAGHDGVSAVNASDEKTGLRGAIPNVGRSD